MRAGDAHEAAALGRHDIRDDLLPGLGGDAHVAAADELRVIGRDRGERLRGRHPIDQAATVGHDVRWQRAHEAKGMPAASSAAV